MGRSYGDAGQLREGLVIDTSRFKGVVLDAEAGLATAEAGVTIGELLQAVVPAGWMVPVVPGTQHVSLGGALASDIHGKNHGTAGTLGAHVRSLELLDAAGQLHHLAPPDDLFRATIGGMGLTGVIVRAQIRLRPVRTALVSVDSDRVVGLEPALEALRVAGGSHRVAWLDLLAGRPRGIVTRAEHLEASPGRGLGAPVVRARAAVPRRWPPGLLRAGTVRLFNELRFRAAAPRARGQVEDLGRHMFPLDALEGWPRLYGPRGFRQYQLAVPPERADVLEAVIGQLRRARVPCFLAVLKDLGPEGSPWLSFPIEGWTLTLDLPRAAAGIERALDACDELVARAGGRVYLAKDDRLRPEMLAAMYPGLRDWQEVRERADPERLWCSDLARRTGLIPPHS